jgi:hypothetical protein
MHEIQLGSGQLRQAQHPVDRLLLGHDRPRVEERPHPGATRGQRLRGQRRDQIAVLAVHLDRQSVLGTPAHHVIDDAVGRHQPELWVRDVQLQATDPELGQASHVLGGHPIRAPQRRVERDVEARVGQHPVARPLEAGDRVLAVVGPGERQRGRGAAEQRLIGGRDVGQQVDVGVDAAGEHEATARIDPVAVEPSRLGDRDDPLVLDHDIANDDTRRRDNPPTGDHGEAHGERYDRRAMENRYVSI